MKKLVALLLALVMVLSLSTVVFAAGPLPLFDPELVGKDDGGMGRPAYVKLPTVKPSVKYGPDGQPIPIVGTGDTRDNPLASALGQFAANTVAALLYQPARYLAGAITVSGAKLERDINRAAPAVSFAAKTMESQLTLAIDTVEYVTKGIVYMGTALYREIIDENAGASDIYKTIEGICGLIEQDVENAAMVIKTAMDSSTDPAYSGSVMGGSIHTAVNAVSDWLLNKDNFRSYERDGVIATYIFEKLFGLKPLYPEVAD